MGERSTVKQQLVPMSVHYSDQRALTSGMVKMKAIAELLKLASKIPEAQAIIEGSSVHMPAHLLSWEVLATLHQQQQQSL